MGIYIEMNLFFDNNFDVYKIERILNIKPSDCKRKMKLECHHLIKMSI